LFKEIFITLPFRKQRGNFCHPDQIKSFQAPVHTQIKFNKQLSTSVSQHLVSLKFDKWFENKICGLCTEFWKQKSVSIKSSGNLSSFGREEMEQKLDQSPGSPVCGFEMLLLEGAELIAATADGCSCCCAS
jgi:hypothetical protein